MSGGIFSFGNQRQAVLPSEATSAAQVMHFATPSQGEGTPEELGSARPPPQGGAGGDANSPSGTQPAPVNANQPTASQPTATSSSPSNQASTSQTKPSSPSPSSPSTLESSADAEPTSAAGKADLKEVGINRSVIWISLHPHACRR